MILSAMFGAFTLIAAISVRAALLPTVSIIQAAFSVSRRAHSISMRASAMRSSQTECSAMRLPNAVRAEQALAHDRERALRDADRAHAVVDAARAEAALRDLEAAPFAEQEVLRRHAHVVERHVAVAVRRIVVAEDRQPAVHLDPRRVARHQDHGSADGASRPWDRSCP